MNQIFAKLISFLLPLVSSPSSLEYNIIYDLCDFYENEKVLKYTREVSIMDIKETWRQDVLVLQYYNGQFGLPQQYAVLRKKNLRKQMHLLNDETREVFFSHIDEQLIENYEWKCQLFKKKSVGSLKRYYSTHFEKFVVQLLVNVFVFVFFK